MIKNNENKNIIVLTPSFIPNGRKNNNISTILNNNHSSKQDLDIINFIKQKNRFKIQNFFDEKGTKDFLSSKDKALKEIELNEDIESKESSNNTTLIEQRDEQNTKVILKSIIRNKKTISPGKKRGKSKKSLKKVRIIEDDDSTYDYNIYKFIIDNANDSEDKFIEKFNKELKRVGTNKIKRKKEKNNTNIFKSLTKKKNNHSRKSLFTKNDKKLNLFNFSETAKNLMVVEDLNISEINSEKSKNQDKNQISSTCFTSTKKESTKKSIYNQQETIEKIIL